MAEPFVVPLDDLQPSQLYLCDEKLLSILTWFGPDDPAYEPILVAEIDSESVILDGHHRAFAARLARADEVRIVRVSDDVDLEPYRTCVGWCANAGIDSVDDLAGRVLGRESYRERWLDRCQEAFGDE